ncbi:hypothetical protein C0Q70_09325 [Pomacea canaliculata]|uniref:Major facilitator superfamily (MFS) profile domain-containing protein n=1 Tax=Pomacea canaliculata TaxID=400727 RepID=A0A2T7P9H1_POMCA|nr:hypothetical protein C0Q70_09325 [Pomacea canaliculata]
MLLTAFAVSQTFIPLLVARALQGLGSAASAVAGMSIVAERYPDDRGRSKAMGIALGGAALRIIHEYSDLFIWIVAVGYPYGGFMYTFVGKTVPFLIIGALTLVDLGLQWFTLGLQPKEGVLFLRRGSNADDNVNGGVGTNSAAVDNKHDACAKVATRSGPRLVFLPDSVGYLVGTNFFGLAARSIGRWVCTLACMLLISLCLFCPSLTTVVFSLADVALTGITDAAVMPLLALLVDRRHDSFYGCVYAIVQLAVCLAYSVGTWGPTLPCLLLVEALFILNPLAIAHAH